MGHLDDGGAFVVGLGEEVHAENGRQGGIAGAAGSHKGDEITLVYFEADLAEDEKFAGLAFDGLFEVLENCGL